MFSAQNKSLARVAYFEEACSELLHCEWTFLVLQSTYLATLFQVPAGISSVEDVVGVFGP